MAGINEISGRKKNLENKTNVCQPVRKTLEVERTPQESAWNPS